MLCMQSMMGGVWPRSLCERLYNSGFRRACFACKIAMAAKLPAGCRPPAAWRRGTVRFLFRTTTRLQRIDEILEVPQTMPLLALGVEDRPHLRQRILEVAVHDHVIELVEMRDLVARLGQAA